MKVSCRKKKKKNCTPCYTFVLEMQNLSNLRRILKNVNENNIVQYVDLFCPLLEKNFRPNKNT